MSTLIPKPFIRLSVFGETNVGKSQLLQKIVHDTFDIKVQATIGVDQKRWKYDSTVLSPYLRVIAWDTAGHERFRTITRSYYRDVDAYLICYEAMERESVRLQQVRFLNQLYEQPFLALLLLQVHLLCPKEHQETGDRLL